MPDSDAATDSAHDLPDSYTAKLGPTAPEDDQPRDPDELETALREGREKWSNLSFDELITGYRRVIWPLLEATGYDPQSTIPTRTWLRDHDHGNLEYALREYHDTTPRRFCTDAIGVTESSDWEWPTDDERTKERLEYWLTTQRGRGDGVAESTAETKRKRLKTYLEVYPGDDLLAPLQDLDQRAEAFDAVSEAYDRLDRRLSTSRSKYQYHTVIEEFYGQLVTSGRAEFNPASGMMDVYNWDSDSDGSDPVALSPDQIRRLYRAAETSRERLLVVALGAWGLRPSEVAALHRDQLILEPDDASGPYIDFQERKNGPGTVAVLYGIDAVRDHLATLTDRWTDHTAGYLFPSQRSETGHVAASTIGNWFAELVERAGVVLEGSSGATPSPKHCRRYWYDQYSAAMSEVDEWLDAAASEQGSTSGEVLRQNYVPEARIREMRRGTMREQLSDAFDEG